MGTAAKLDSGEVFAGRYEVRQLLGEGDRKRTYLAQDTKMGRFVALSLVKPEAALDDPEGTEREARVLGRIGRHDNIVSLYDYGTDSTGAIQYMVFEYLAGGTLADHLRNSDPPPPGDILRLGRQLCRGLSHLHGRGLIHRDVSLENVWLGERHKAHLGDFDSAITTDGSDACRPMTTNAFAAPEERRGMTLDARSDLYSLGGVLYAVAAGTARPGDPGLLRDLRSDLPAAFAELVASLLSESPDDRPTDAGSVLRQLDMIRHTSDPEKLTRAEDPGNSQPFPQPDPAELRASVGIKATDYAVGDVIDDRFQIIDILGQGGFSKVYRVRDEVEDEERALKLFSNAVGYEAVRREISALRKVRHPNVVEVYWAGKTNAGDWYLITEFIDGEPLHEFITGDELVTRKKRLRDREAVDVTLDVLDALVAFHPDSARLKQLDAKRHDGDLSEAELYEWMELNEKGLVHRDIKPHNVMLTRSGAKLLDFNIASRVGDPVRTQSGTPPYQPPDADLTRWDVSTDLFAVGVILYQLLCDGVHPYPNLKPMIYEPVIDPRTIRRDLRPDLAQFLIKACAPTRADRFATAAEMRDVLHMIRVDL